MKTNKSYGTIFYSLINITYFMAFCTVHAFAAVYLLDKGFSNMIVGVLLAVANVASALLQPLVASLIDKYVKITNRGVSIISALIITAGSVILLFTGSNKAVVFIIFTIMYMTQFTYMPVLTALSFEYQKKGVNIFFGLARGLGSAGFAVTSMFMGTIVEIHGTSRLLYATIIATLVHALMLFLFKAPSPEVESVKADDASNNADGNLAANTDYDLTGSTGSGSEGAAPLSLAGFFKTYPVFIILLVATTLLFFTHNMLNDYLIQIVRNVGGSESDLGYATFLSAILELPTMAVVSAVSKKVNMKRLLILAGVFFSLKSIVMMFATSMALVYISQSMQLLAYAVFIPASAYYVSENISLNDQVKGQALITSCFTLSGVFSSLICGAILDSLGVGAMLITGAAVSILGTITIIAAMIKKQK